ncbi:hypothetical protein F4781DRAFT_405288 [Annulohypoxylon bovei var. microspora]|nr:hypothetical protein F4781DRAFT_405288 [Annulohypoxylon bovei var. microspora]
MARDAVTPTLVTIVFILFTGLYGFVKFSYEKDHVFAGNINTILAAAELGSPAPTSPTLADHDYIGLEKSSRPLITYVYTETTSIRENLIFFLDNGLHGAADFVFILNGPTDVASLIPHKTNIEVISRPTECSHLTAHGEVLRKDGLWKKYNRFIMLNAAVRGPFMPFWSRSCWNDVFLDRITEHVKLSSMTASCLPKFHVESMIWATDTIGMELMLDPLKGSLVPDVPYKNHNQVVASGSHFNNMKQAIYSEIEATRVIKFAGYKVDVLVSSFSKIEDHEENCAMDSIEDVVFGQHYSIHPYETVFAKAGRDTDSVTIARLTEWHQSRITNGSWDVCH